jgi:hypothetical protein
MKKLMIKYLIILVCLIILPFYLHAAKNNKTNQIWWLETTVVRDDGIILNRNLVDNYTMYKNKNSCLQTLKTLKIYGATGGDAQVVVILKCVKQKSILK